MNTNLHRCTRYLEEIKAPFEDKSSAVYRAGLRLISAEQMLFPCFAQDAWQAKLDKGMVFDKHGKKSDIVIKSRTDGPDLVQISRIQQHQTVAKN